MISSLPPQPSSSHAERFTSAGPDATSPTSTAAEVGAILDEVEAWLTQCGLGRIAPDAAWVAEWSEMHCYAEMARDPTARARFEDEMQLDATERGLLDTALQTRFNSGSSYPDFAKRAAYTASCGALQGKLVPSRHKWRFVCV